MYRTSKNEETNHSLRRGGGQREFRFFGVSAERKKPISRFYVLLARESAHRVSEKVTKNDRDF